MKRFFALSLLVLLGGCGFRPLYGTNSAGQSVAAEISAVTVNEQSTRPGQLVRNEIMSSGIADSPRYKLVLSVTESKAYVSRLPGSSTDRFRETLSANYELKELGSGRSITQGTTQSTVSYDTVREPIADVQARTAAIQRAAIELGQDIKLRLAAALAR